MLVFCVFGVAWEAPAAIRVVSVPDWQLMISPLTYSQLSLMVVIMSCYSFAYDDRFDYEGSVTMPETD